jgi:sugar lactone lactonase YvrE
MKMHSSLLVLVASAASSTCLLAQPVITQQPADQVVANGGTLTLSVAVSGTGPFTYQWLFNGADIGSAITTVAGNGTGVFAGDGGQATNASLHYPNDVAMDRAGNLFIGLSHDHRVRKVDSNGIITTVAGTGSPAYSGDTMAATNASLNEPGGVAVDGAGNLFIADSANHRIRKVDTNGIITTVAGNGSTGYSGDNVAATNTSLYYPTGVAVDGAGNLFIADSANNRIRKVNTNGIITIVAGNGGMGYSGDNGAATNASIHSPAGVAVDGAGNLFIADLYNNRIRKVNTNGIITTVAGTGSRGCSGDNGAATNAWLDFPIGVAVDRAGNLFIADFYNHRIRKVDGNGIITTIAGNGVPSFSGDGNAAVDASLFHPSGVTMDGFDNLFIADQQNLRIRKVYSWPATSPVLTLRNISTNSIGSYSVVISDSTGSVTSSVAALNMPAYVASQPTGRTVWQGASASFASAAGGSQPLSYQWSWNGTNIGGATNASYTITNVVPANAGPYAVAVTNRYGSVTSWPAVLTVLTSSPKFESQPVSVSAYPGEAVGFTIKASGAPPLAYQWFFNGATLPGMTNTALSIASVQYSHAGDYRCRVTNDYGSMLSSNAILTVLSPPACIPVPAGAVAWWRGESNLWDAIGFNDAASISSTNTNSYVSVSYGSGKVGLTPWLMYSGNNPFLVVAPAKELDLGAGQGFTVEGWVKVSGYGSAPVMSWNDSHGNIGASLSIRAQGSQPPPPPP